MPRYVVDNYVVYEVQGDGSRRECAYIEENGEVVPYDATTSKLSFPAPKDAPTPAAGKRQSGGWLVVAVTVLALGCAALGTMLYQEREDRGNDHAQSERQLTDAQSRIDDLEGTVAELREQVSELKASNSEATAALDKAAEKMPFIVQQIQVGNVYSDNSIETQYGSTIHASRTMFLRPKITYYGLTDGSNELTVKWIYPDGKTSQQPAHSYSTEKGSHTLELLGWGNSNMGYWKSGNYRVELWRGGVCLGSTAFTVWK